MRKRIGLLGHDLHLYAELTARQNLTFFAELYGLKTGAPIDVALERANLTDRADDQVVGFSRGMRQRLGLERALLHDPRLVLLDEPFTGLDDQSVLTVTTRLRQLAAERRDRARRHARPGSGGRPRHADGADARGTLALRRTCGARTAGPLSQRRGARVSA